MRPNDWSKKEIEAAVIPFPSPEMTPPDINIYFVFIPLRPAERDCGEAMGGEKYET